jgi:hypothetical protein
MVQRSVYSVVCDPELSLLSYLEHVVLGSVSVLLPALGDPELSVQCCYLHQGSWAQFTVSITGPELSLQGCHLHQGSWAQFTMLLPSSGVLSSVYSVVTCSRWSWAKRKPRLRFCTTHSTQRKAESHFVQIISYNFISRLRRRWQIWNVFLYYFLIIS